MIVYTQNVTNAIMLASALNAIKYKARTLRYKDLTPEIIADISSEYTPLCYFEGVMGGEKVFFTWGNDYFKVAEPSSDEEIEVGLKFKLARNTKQSEARLRSILNNGNELTIVCACVGESAVYDFLKAYTYCKMTEIKGKTIKRAKLPTLNEDDIRVAFSSLEDEKKFEVEIKAEETKRAVYFASNFAVKFCLQNIIGGYQDLPFRFVPFIQYVAAAETKPKREEIAEYFGCGDYGLNLPQANYGINILINGEYISEKEGCFGVTSKGKKVLKVLSPYGDLLSGELLSDWECKIAEMEVKQEIRECSQIAGELKTSVGSFLRKLCNELEAINISTGVKCPHCGEEDLSSDGTRFYCLGCDWEIKRYLHGRAFADKELAYLVVKRETPIIDGFVDNGNYIRGRIYLDEDNTPKFTRNTKYTCPRCGRPLYVGSDRENYYCPATNACGFSVNREYFGHKLSRNEVKELLTNKLSPLIKGLNVDGKKCSGRLYLDPHSNFSVKLLIQKNN